MDVELMDIHRHTEEVDDYICLRAFPKENFILTHYMLSAWWLHLLDGLLHCVIRPGEVAQILVITNNTMTLGYIYAKYRLKKPPEIFCNIAHIRRLIARIPSKWVWNPEL